MTDASPRSPSSPSNGRMVRMTQGAGGRRGSAVGPPPAMGAPKPELAAKGAQGRRSSAAQLDPELAKLAAVGAGAQPGSAAQLDPELAKLAATSAGARRGSLAAIGGGGRRGSAVAAGAGGRRGSALDPALGSPVGGHGRMDPREQRLAAMRADLEAQRQKQRRCVPRWLNDWLDNVDSTGPKAWLRKAFLFVIAIATCYKKQRQLFVLETIAELPERSQGKTLIIRRKQEDYETMLAMEQKAKKRRSGSESRLKKAFKFAKKAISDQLNEMRVHQESGLPLALLEKYALIELESVGPHGFVYRATGRKGGNFAVQIRDKSFGDVVQIGVDNAKQLMDEVIVNKNFLQRLARCRLPMKKFVHAAIVEHYAALSTNEYFIVVTEYLDGGTLHDRLEGNPSWMDEYKARSIMSQLLRALAYLHDKRILHRDVRLKQILFARAEDTNLTIKLCDFWCARKLPKKRRIRDPFRPVDVVVTAPEVLEEGLWTAKADCWSAGCAMFEMLFGHPPFGGEGASLIHRVFDDPPEFDPHAKISKNGVNLISSMLLKEKDHRPTAKHSLTYKWFAEFNLAQKPEKRQHTNPQAIPHVKILSSSPTRRGMEAENLLNRFGGVQTSGFCSEGGSQLGTIVFQIGGGNKDYYVNYVLVSIWASPANPKKVEVFMTCQPNGLWKPVGEHNVLEEDAFARIDVEMPTAFLKLTFRGHYGSELGIGLRKVSFYGYEVVAIPVQVNMETADYQGGCQVEKNVVEQSQLDTMPAYLKERLEKSTGEFGENKVIIRDIYGGPIHTMPSLRTPPIDNLNLIPGHSIFACSLALRFSMICPPFAAQPKVLLRLVTSSEQVEKSGFFGKDVSKVKETLIPIFTTDALTGVDHDDFLKEGYTELMPFVKTNLDVPTDHPIALEVGFVNHAGQVWLDPDISMKLFFIPDTVSSESEEEEEEKDHKDEMQTKSRSRKGGVTDLFKKKKAEEGSDHGSSEEFENELREDLDYKRSESVFDRAGMAGGMDAAEVHTVNGMELLDFTFGQQKSKKKPWWEASEANESEFTESLSKATDDDSFDKSERSQHTWSDDPLASKDAWDAESFAENSESAEESGSLAPSAMSGSHTDQSSSKSASGSKVDAVGSGESFASSQSAAEDTDRAEPKRQPSKEKGQKKQGLKASKRLSELPTVKEDDEDPNEDEDEDDVPYIQETILPSHFNALVCGKLSGTGACGGCAACSNSSPPCQQTARGWGCCGTELAGSSRHHGSAGNAPVVLRR